MTRAYCVLYSIMQRGYVDSQVKKGLLDICVLAALNRGDSYGWQIIKDVGVVVEISEGTLYPILKRLEAGNLVETYEVAHNGRLRKYFKITSGGKTRLKMFEQEQEQLIKIYEFISGSLRNPS